jgi:hypothetical protein
MKENEIEDLAQKDFIKIIEIVNNSIDVMSENEKVKCHQIVDYMSFILINLTIAFYKKIKTNMEEKSNIKTLIDLNNEVINKALGLI